MSIFSRLFQREEAAKAVITRPGWWDYLLNGPTSTSAGYADTPAGWLMAATRNVWARNCIQSQASALAPIPLRLFDGDGAEVETHPILDVLDRINDVNDDPMTFRRGVVTSRQIFGRCVVLKVRGAKGQVAELYRIPMQVLKLLPSEREFIVGWQDIRNNRIYPRADMIDFVRPHPDGSGAADSPTSAAIEYINSYTVANVSARAIDKRGGQMGGIVAYDATMLVTDSTRMADAWDTKRNNPENAGRDLHMPPGTTYTTGAFSAVDMQRESRMTRLGKEIMGIYGVPPAVAGDYSDASVLANAAIQDRAFWTYWGLAELSAIEETLNWQLLWRDWPETKAAGFKLRHDIKTIPSLQEDTGTRGERSTFLFAAKIISLNEARELSGFDALPVPEADNIEMVLANSTQINADGETAAAAAAPPPPAPIIATKAMPVVDFVGMMATDVNGTRLGIIDKIHRFGVYAGMTATKAAPVVVIGDIPYRAADVLVTIGE